MIRGCETDTLFGTGYYYRWLTDYSDLALEDYLKDHPLPNGIAYSEGPFGQGNYGASSYFGDKTKQIWFEFSSDEEFEDCLDELEPWLDKWLKSERKYLSDGKDPIIRVSAYREKDNEFDVIMLFRVFGYEKDSFHKIGEDGQTYKWDSFRKAMEAGYEAKKELLKK